VLGYELVGNERVPIRVPRLSSGATMVAELKLPTTTRGLHLIPPLMLRGSDPFGLFDLSRSIGESSTLWIYPRPQAGVPALDDDAVRELDASVSARSLAGGTTFDGLRAYQPHDDSRLIHWPSYARSGELLVRHHIVGNESRHLVVLDTSDVYGDEESFEAAVRVAASWCAAGMSAAAAVSLATTDGLYVDVAAGYSDFDGARQLWEALARAQVHKGSRAPSTPVDLPSRAPATALGWVTGPLASEVSDTASALIQAVSHAAAARIGGALPTRIMHHPGLLEITAATPQAWAGAWGKAMGA
jgi:uncharacterized protein (DUF58 family)